MPPDLLSYAHVLAFARNWFGKGLLWVVIALFAWHAAHRIFHSLHDLGQHTGALARAACYGSAAVLTLISAGALLSLGF